MTRASQIWIHEGMINDELGGSRQFYLPIGRQHLYQQKNIE
ncbi:MAG TPA: hypothetical protein VIN72_02495 [Lutibacter sp.]